MTDFERKDFEEILGRRGVPWERRDVWEGSFFRYQSGDSDRTIRNTMVIGTPPRPTKEEIDEMRRRLTKAAKPGRVKFPPDTTDEQVADLIVQGMINGAYALCLERAERAPGVMMRRHPVPEAHQFLFAEMRPDHPILSGRPNVRSHRGMRRRDRRLHIARSRTPRSDVERGCTPAELKRFQKIRGWNVTEGADHAGVPVPVGQVHVHLSIPKYLFPRNAKKTERVEHDHSEHTDRELREHLYQEHDYPRYAYEGSRRKPRDPVAREIFRQTPGSGGRSVEFLERRLPRRDKRHVHAARIDKTFYARRLSSHPMGFARIAEADWVAFAMEGEIKEAALVVAGWATVSCPSISLWDAPELEPFVRNHLRGKNVLVIVDSDWEPGKGVRRDDDLGVYRQAIRLREALRLYGANAFITAPPHPKNCSKGCDKHGVDDHLAHGVTGRRPGTMDQLVWVDVEAAPKGTLDGWYDSVGVSQPSGRVLRWDRVDRDEIVLRWLSLIAYETGGTTIALRSLAKCVKTDLEDLYDRKQSEQAAVQRVWQAIREMDPATAEKTSYPDGVSGPITGAASLKERIAHHIRKTEDWVGEITIVDPDLRARFSTEQTALDLRLRVT